jgi:hypothetical protein
LRSGSKSAQRPAAVAVAVAVALAVAVGAAAVGVGVAVACGEALGVAVGVAASVGRSVAVPVAVAVGVSARRVDEGVLVAAAGAPPSSPLQPAESASAPIGRKKRASLPSARHRPGTMIATLSPLLARGLSDNSGKALRQAQGERKSRG